MLYTLGDQPAVLSIDKSAIETIRKLSNKKIKLLANKVDGNITKIDEYSDCNPRRNFAAIRFKREMTSHVKQIVHENFDGYSHLLFYYDKNNTMFVLELDKSLSRQKYATFVKNLARNIGVKATPTYTNIIKPLIIKKFDHNQIIDYTIKDPFPITSSEVTSDNDDDNEHILLNNNRLTKATESFFSTSKAKKILHDRSEATKLFDSIATSYLNGMLNSTYIDTFLSDSAKASGYSITDWRNLFEERIELLKNNASLKETAAPFGDYIHLYNQTNSKASIGTQLIDLLPRNAKPDPDYDLSEACNFIEMAFPPYLLDQQGSDVDNLVIFDPSKGLWIHDQDSFFSLLTAIKPYSTPMQLTTFMMTFAAKARNANRIIKPYSGSRYIIFNNCMLDVLTFKTYALSDPIVRDMHFIDRCHLDVDYIDNPKLPIFKHMRQWQDGPWNPQDFLMAYADNKQDRYEYLLFGLSLGLFGGHNFGVHFDIKGGARFGKTSLIEPLNALYNYRTQLIPLSSLNNQFPFTSYKPNTSIIWLNENNAGIDPLNDTYGTTTYDALADNEIHLHIKNHNDMIISNPPQVYIDGTQFVKANDMYTGPAGRTLVFALPTMTTALRHQMYGKNITELLHNKKVLQWLVYNELLAYKEFVPQGRMDNFRLNLGNKQDRDLFPPITLEWRKQMVVGGSTIDDWFADYVEPYLSTDPNKPTFLHQRVLYAMYLDAYKQDSPNDRYNNHAKKPDYLMRRLKAIFDSEADKYNVQYNIGSKEKGRPKPRKMIKDPDHMNFDWKAFDQDFRRPANLDSQGYPNLGIFNKRSTGWFSIVKITKNNTQGKN